MAHLAFVCPPFLGHLNPMAALARELVGRGHRATFLHMPDAEPLVGERGFGFRPVGRVTHPPGHLARVLRRLSGVNGPFGLGAIIRDVAATTEMLCRELPDALRRVGADALVCDGTEAAGGLVADHLGMPLVTVANALPLNREPAVPPPFTAWGYDPSRWGLDRNRGGYRVSDFLMSPHGKVIEAFARDWKLRDRHTLEDCLSPLAQISQLVPGLDFPREELPRSFHYVGPLRADELDSAEFRMPRPDARPLGYASLGTLQGARASLFGRIAAAGESCGLRLVVAHAGGLSDEKAAALPGDPAVFAFVPQQRVLQEARVAILNGGLNTVLDALAAGVPIVVLPIAFEQGAIAARVTRAGAGTTVSPRFLTRRKLARAIRTVIEDPAYARAAARLGAEIRAAGGVSRAANIVEKVVATGRPVLRDEPAAPLPQERARMTA